MQRRIRGLMTVIGALAVAMSAVACGSNSPTVTSATTATAVAGTSASYRQPPAGIATVQLFQPLNEYSDYVEHQLAAIHPQLRVLDAAIAGRALLEARTDWLTAHLTWLKIGQDDGQYGAFGNLGGAIDGLSDGDVGGTASPQFTGFHKVEFDLFRRDDLTAAKADADKLTFSVDSITPHVLSADLPLNVTGLDAWVLRTHEILEDALRDSLSQNDDDGSNSDFASIGADVTATREMLNVLSGLIEPRDPGLVQTARRQLTTITQVLATIPAGREPSTLPLRQRQRIDGAVSAALETLAPVSELMQISDANS